MNFKKTFFIYSAVILCVGALLLAIPAVSGTLFGYSPYANDYCVVTAKIGVTEKTIVWGRCYLKPSGFRFFLDPAGLVKTDEGGPRLFFQSYSVSLQQTGESEDGFPAVEFRSGEKFSVYANNAKTGSITLYPDGEGGLFSAASASYR